MVTFVLLHSPLVGPLTWALVANALRQKSIDVVPVLSTIQESGEPYWKQHAQAVVQALEPVPADRPLVLIGHSGAGVLLPAIRQMAARPVAGYIFVDAIIPRNGASRLDLFESPQAAEQFRQAASNGLIPAWRDEDLREVIEDAEIRQRFVAELRPLPLAVYEEPIPVFEGWPDAPCAYLRFSPIYRTAAERAQGEGWLCMEIEGGHFHMLVDPQAVANALMELADRMGIVAV